MTNFFIKKWHLTPLVHNKHVLSVLVPILLHRTLFASPENPFEAHHGDVNYVNHIEKNDKKRRQKPNQIQKS
jgi:hypothetical protein